MIDAGIEDRFTSLDNCQLLQLAAYPGVYFLCKGATVVYVGKTKNIARRLAAHCGSKDFDTVMVMSVPEELLHSVEMHWIRRLQPALNIMKPGPQPLGKITVTIRMFPRTKRALDKAARSAKKQISEYIEELVLTHLRTDPDD